MVTFHGKLPNSCETVRLGAHVALFKGLCFSLWGRHPFRLVGNKEPGVMQASLQRFIHCFPLREK